MQGSRSQLGGEKDISRKVNPTDLAVALQTHLVLITYGNGFLFLEKCLLRVFGENSRNINLE